MIINHIKFPNFIGPSIKCNMMPYIQGKSSSLPELYRSYSDIVDANYLQKGKVGFLTIDESFVDAGKSQRGFSYNGTNRNVHIEVGRRYGRNKWGGGTWGGKSSTELADDTQVLIANSVSNTCRVWDVLDMSETENGDLSDYLHRYPEHTGRLLEAGEVAKISIFTPHECVLQETPGPRQFIRIVGVGVKGREDYFTINPLIDLN